MSSFVCQKIIFFGLGSFILLVGGIISGIWPIIFNHKLRSQLALTENSKSFLLWKKTPIPMFIDFYMFNWTNPEETLNRNVIPTFTEKGPYVFSEDREKIIVAWNDNGTVTFKQRRKWVFRPELSSGSLSDEITNVNVIAMTIGNLLKQYIGHSPLVEKLVNSFLKGLESKVYTTRTVGELLFYGYDDPFLELANKLAPLIKQKLPMDKFGWFYKRNMSADFDGVFNMMTGEHSLDSLGILKRWNFKSKTNFFSGDCGLIDGTTGELWPLDSPHKAKATIFASDLCSKMDLDWDSETDIYGARGSLFQGSTATFDNNTSCYCIEKCHPSGVRDISTCRFGAPAFISFPHFYLADPIYREMVAGMEPSKKNHTFDLTLHKVTGIPLSVNARLQINVLVDKIPGLNFYEKLPRAYIPMIWFNERAAITPDLASQLAEIQVFGYFEPCFFLATGIGGILIIIGLFLWATGVWKSSSLNKPLLEDNSN